MDQGGRGGLCMRASAEYLPGAVAEVAEKPHIQLLAPARLRLILLLRTAPLRRLAGAAPRVIRSPRRAGML